MNKETPEHNRLIRSKSKSSAYDIIADLYDRNSKIIENEANKLKVLLQRNSNFRLKHRKNKAQSFSSHGQLKA